MSDGDVFNLNTIRLILTKLRDLAVKHNVLVIMSAHPKKPNDSKPPTAYDIAHSADFKNRADYNITIHRNKGAKVQNGVLADVAPRILHIMGLEQPAEMTGKNLIED